MLPLTCLHMTRRTVGTKFCWPLGGTEHRKEDHRAVAISDVCLVGFVSPTSIPQIGTVKKEKVYPLLPTGSQGSDLEIL